MPEHEPEKKYSMTIETQKRKYFRLTVRKQVRVPTLLGWIVLCAVAVGLVILVAQRSCVFLSYHKPIQADALIIEGWVPDYVLEQGLTEFNAGPYRWILSTGGPLSKGSHLSRYRTYAELSAASLAVRGGDPNKIVALPAPHVPKDRTRVSALEVQTWLINHPDIKTMNIMTLGPHARRTYLEFRRVLPQTVKLGVICIPNEDFDDDTWWTSSAGVKTVITEGLAYLFKRLGSL
jgi:hypothetical protein